VAKEKRRVITHDVENLPLWMPVQQRRKHVRGKALKFRWVDKHGEEFADGPNLQVKVRGRWYDVPDKDFDIVDEAGDNVMEEDEPRGLEGSDMYFPHESVPTSKLPIAPDMIDIMSGRRRLRDVSKCRSKK